MLFLLACTPVDFVVTLTITHFCPVCLPVNGFQKPVAPEKGVKGGGGLRRQRRAQTAH